MFEKISYTWELMGASWEVLKKDKELIFFPLLSGISCLILIASFIVPISMTDSWEPPQQGDATTGQYVTYYGTLFLFYFLNYFIITFFNTGIVACAVSRMAGGDPTFMGGLREAIKRLPLIIGWSVVSATVGLILHMIEERSEKLGQIVAAMLGTAWTLMTFLVVPVLVVENKGPFQALKESASLLRKTWGEQVVGNFSFGLIFFLMTLPAYVVGGIGVFLFMQTGSLVLPAILIGCAVVAVIVLALIQSALQSIFQAAVYMHTQGVQAPGFPVKMLRGAMA